MSALWIVHYSGVVTRLYRLWVKRKLRVNQRLESNIEANIAGTQFRAVQIAVCANFRIYYSFIILYISLCKCYLF